MPRLGLGTFKMSAANGDVNRAVQAALTAGIRLIDTAAIYKNEGAVWEAVQECCSHTSSGRGAITRDQVFITTKVTQSFVACRTAMQQADRCNASNCSADLLWVLLSLCGPCAHSCRHTRWAQPKHVRASRVHWQRLEVAPLTSC
jgi:diketogulonate reductase-like aldo/keto reductase